MDYKIGQHLRRWSFVKKHRPLCGGGDGSQILTLVFSFRRYNTAECQKIYIFDTKIPEQKT